MRRYAVANRLNRFGTLTSAAATSDPAQVCEDIGDFFKRLRSFLGMRIPYVWITELHLGGRRPVAS